MLALVRQPGKSVCLTKDFDRVFGRRWLIRQHLRFIHLHQDGFQFPLESFSIDVLAIENVKDGLRILRDIAKRGSAAGLDETSGFQLLQNRIWSRSLEFETDCNLPFG